MSNGMSSHLTYFRVYNTKESADNTQDQGVTWSHVWTSSNQGRYSKLSISSVSSQLQIGKGINAPGIFSTEGQIFSRYCFLSWFVLNQLCNTSELQVSPVNFKICWASMIQSCVLHSHWWIIKRSNHNHYSTFQLRAAQDIPKFTLWSIEKLPWTEWYQQGHITFLYSQSQESTSIMLLGFWRGT